MSTASDLLFNHLETVGTIFLQYETFKICKQTAGYSILAVLFPY